MERLKCLMKSSDMHCFFSRLEELALLNEHHPAWGGGGGGAQMNAHDHKVNPIETQ